MGLTLLQYDRSAEAKAKVEDLLQTLHHEDENVNEIGSQMSSLELCSGTSGITLTSVNPYFIGYVLIAYRLFLEWDCLCVD